MAAPPSSVIDASAAATTPSMGLTLLLCAIVGAVDLGGPIFYPGLGKIATEFGVSPAQAQLAVTVNMIGAAVSQPFLGPAGDWFGRRKVLLASLLALASLSLLTVAITSFPVLIAVRAVQGFLGSAGIVLARALAHDLFVDQRQFTRVVSYLVVTTGACSLLGPLLAGGLVNAFGWRAPVLLLAALSGIVLVVAVLMLRRYTEQQGSLSEASQWPGWASLGALLRNPVFYGSTALLSFSMAPLFTLFGLSPMLLSAGGDKSPMQVAMLVSILSCAFMAGAFLGGMRTATQGIVRLASVSIAVGFAIIAVAIMMRGVSLTTIVPGGLIIALASGYLNPITLALALQANARLAGTASGWSSAISLVFAGIGTQLATLVSSANSAWLIAIGAGYALLCWLSIKPAMNGDRRSTS